MQFSIGWIVAGVLVVALLIVLWRSRIIVYVPNNRVGIVEKLWSASGSITSGILATDHRAGFQADIIRGGLHFFPPFQFRVHKLPWVCQ